MKTLRLLLAAAWVLSLAAAAAGAAVDTGRAAGTPAGPVKAALVDDIVFQVGNEIITRFEIEEPLRQLAERMRSEYRGQELQDKLQTARTKLVQRLVEEKLLLLEARAQKLEVPETQVTQRAKQQMEALRKQFPGDQAFRDQLKREHLTEGELLKYQEKMIREALLRQQLLQGKIQEFSTGAEVSDDQLQKYYSEHSAEFKRPDRARVSQIFMNRPDPGLPADLFARQDDEARRKMEEALAQLRAGKDFAAVALHYSEHRVTAEKGGEVGWLEKGEIGLPEFDREVFEKLRVGQTSGVIGTARGFFIVHLEDRQPGGVIPFDEVKGRIRQKLMNEGSEDRYRAWVESLKQKYPVVEMK